MPTEPLPRVLLVDDEEEFVQALAERLEARGFEAAVVFDGEQALQHLAADPPQVMVVDLMMPGIDGLEVLRRVRREPAAIEVILVTGHGSAREEALARDLGAFAYLNKPLAIEALASSLKEAGARARRAAREQDPDRHERHQ